MSFLFPALLQQRAVRTFALLADASGGLPESPHKVEGGTGNNDADYDVLKHSFSIFVPLFRKSVIPAFRQIQNRLPI